MTVIVPVTTVVFPDTNKDDTSIVSMQAYKNVIGRASNVSVDSAKPFSFKTQLMADYAQSSLADLSYSNGVRTTSEVYDMVDDLLYGYSIELNVNQLGLLRREKASISSVTTLALIGSSSFTGTPQISQDKDFVYVSCSYLSAGNNILSLRKISKTTMTVSDSVNLNFGASQRTSTGLDVSDNFVFLSLKDPTLTVSTLYVFDKTNLLVSDNTTLLTTGLYDVNAVNDQLCIVSGVDADKVGFYVFKCIAGSDPELQSQNYLEEFTDQTASSDLDLETNPGTVYGLSSGAVSGTIFEHEYCGSAAGDWADGVTGDVYIETESIINGIDFTFDSKLNLGARDIPLATSVPVAVLSDSASDKFSVTVGQAAAGVYNVQVNIASPSNVMTLACSGVITSLTNLKAYSTLRVWVRRLAGAWAIRVNGELVTVTTSAGALFPIEANLPGANPFFQTIHNSTADDSEAVYKFIRFRTNNKWYLDEDFSNGNTDPVRHFNLFSKSAVFSNFNSSSSIMKRITAQNGFLTGVNSGGSVINVERQSYKLTGKIVSHDLDGFSDSVTNIMRRFYRSVDGFYYLAGRMPYNSVNYNHIVKMTTRLFGGVEVFSFSCNASLVYFKFAPTSVGNYFDNLTLEDIASVQSATLPLVASCYAEDASYDVKSAIVKYGEGHKDIVRYASTPVKKNIDTYRRKRSTDSGTLYSYSSFDAKFEVSATGQFVKETLSIEQQSESNPFNAWLDTVNIFFDFENPLLADNLLEIFMISSTSAMKAKISIALDTNYNFNLEQGTFRISQDKDTSLLSNTSVAVTGKKQIEQTAIRHIEKRDSYCLKFRIQSLADDSYDVFRIYRLKYTPSTAFYIGGSNVENSD